MSAQDDEVFTKGERVGHRLVELFAVRCGENHFVVVPFRLQGRDAAVYRFALHHHARKAAERIVVHPAVLIRGIVAQVVQMDFHQAFLLGTS